MTFGWCSLSNIVIIIYIYDTALMWDFKHRATIINNCFDVVSKVFPDHSHALKVFNFVSTIESHFLKIPLRSHGNLKSQTFH